MECMVAAITSPKGSGLIKGEARLSFLYLLALQKLHFSFKVQMKDDLLNLTDLYFILYHFFLLCGLLTLSTP